MPASVWWTLITVAYMWGYQEGRQLGQLEGFTRAMNTWLNVHGEIVGSR